MDVDIEVIRELAPEIRAMSLEQLVLAINDDLTTPRAYAALAALFFRARRPQVVNYRDYLNSPTWKATRQRKLNEAGRQCSLCPSRKTLQVHHRTYDRVGRERMEDLVVLCRTCHSRHHGALA